MSKIKNNSTREAILAKAIEMINVYGVEQVGIREIAREMGLHVGNVTYYFPRKTDLVLAMLELNRERNSSIFKDRECNSFRQFYEIFRDLFHNQYELRGLYFGYSFLLNDEIRLPENYPAAFRRRLKLLTQLLISLQANKSILPSISNEQLESHAQLITYLSRFWLIDLSMRPQSGSLETIIRSYLKELISSFLPLVTSKGKKEIEERI